MIKLIRIAENPKMTMRFVKKGIAIIPAVLLPIVCLASILPNNTNNRNDRLQIKVTLDKNENNFIRYMF